MRNALAALAILVGLSALLGACTYRLTPDGERGLTYSPIAQSGQQD
jgi:hypothetical protein